MHQLNVEKNHLPLVSVGEGINWKDTAQKDVCIKEVYDFIKSPPIAHQQQIGRIQDFTHQSFQENSCEYTRSLKEKIDKLKKELPSFTISGTFPSGQRKKEKLIQHSGRLQIDLDNLSLEQVPIVKNQLAQDTYIEAVFISPTGTGVKAVMRIPVCKDDQEHKQAFLAADHYLRSQYGLEIDQSTKDVARLCFASWDPDLVFNDNAVELDISQWQSSRIEVITSNNEESSQPGEAYAQKVLETSCLKIGEVPDGERHNTRLKRAKLVGGYVSGGSLDHATTLEQLKHVAQSNTDHPEKAVRDIEDGFEEGLKKPLYPTTTGGNELKLGGKKQKLLSREEMPDWGVPQPLRSNPEPAPYPIQSLPPIIRKAVEEVAAFVKAPISIVAASALATISTVAQAHFNVRRDDGLEGPISLYFLSIADSGDRKTSSSKFSRSIQKHQNEEKQRLAMESKEYEAKNEVWKSKHNFLKMQLKEQHRQDQPTDQIENALIAHLQNEPEAPRIPKWIRKDFTIESVPKKLNEWPAAVIESDEGGSVFGSYSMRESPMKTLADLNGFWDGKTIQIDRSKSESLHLDGVRLSAALMLQGPTLREFLRQSRALARGTGFLARFLISWPKSMIGQRLFQKPPKGWPALTAFDQRMEHLLSEKVEINSNGGLELKMLELDEQAKEIWVQFHDKLEVDLGPGKPLHDVRDVASKTAENAARIAAVFFAFSTLGKRSQKISKDFMESACAVALWHLYEAQRFFNEITIPLEQEHAQKVEERLIVRCRNGGTSEITKRELQQNGPVRDGKQLDAALNILEDLERCRIFKDGKKTLIQINPALLED